MIVWSWKNQIDRETASPGRDDFASFETKFTIGWKLSK